jgi:hypothetical protein
MQLLAQQLELQQIWNCSRNSWNIHTAIRYSSPFDKHFASYRPDARRDACRSSRELSVIAIRSLNFKFFMSSTCFETEDSSSGRRLYNRYSVVWFICIRWKSVFNTHFPTYKTVYGSSWAWFTEITEGWACVCVWLSHCMWRHLSQCLTTDSTSDTGAGHMFRQVETARPTPLLFRVFLFYFAFLFHSCTILRHPSTPHHPLPLNCLSAATYHIDDNPLFW